MSSSLATDASAGAAPSPSERPRPDARHLTGALVGSAVEVFDWTAYSTFAAFFAASFFTGGGGTAYVQTLIVFAVGFIARPVGSLVFGRISDLRGRRASLIATSSTALVGTLIIAVAPTVQVIGIGAALILMVGRIIQGLAHGGEQPAAGAYVSEIASPERRGAWSSLIYVSITIGGLGGTLLGAILSSTLGADALTAWAWRIPFLVAGVGSIIAILLARRLEETPVFVDAAARAERPRLFAEMLRAWRPALQIIALTLGITIAFQNWAAIGGYHIAVLGSDPSQVLWTGVGANVATLIALPLWGMLSDRIGRRPVLLIGLIGAAVVTWPLMHYLDGSWQHMAIAMGVSLVLLAAPLSILPALMAELVPTSIRTIGVGFSYAVATAIFGGTVPALQAAIGGAFGPASFGIYVALALVISVIAALRIPETRGLDLHQTS